MKRIVVFSLALIILAVLAVSLLIYGTHWSASSPSWDGGLWSDTQTLPFASSKVIEFDDKLFMFYTEVTKDTIDKVDDALGPGEYQLWDVFYRTYDGLNYSKEMALTSPTDEVRVHADFVVYEDNLYAVLREEWITNYTSYEWASRVRMEFFDGAEWHEAQGPYAEGELLYGAPNYFAYDGKIWAVRQNQEPNVYMPNQYSYKEFNRSIWSAPHNFSFPTGEPNNWKFMVFDSQLWAVWENVTVQTSQPPYHREEDTYLGRFDGENWANVTMVSLPEDAGSNIWPSAVAYQGELLVFWSSEHFGGSDLVLRRFNLSDGSLSDLVKASPDPGYIINFSVETCLYGGRLYMLAGGLIWNFNGTSVSNGYRFPDRSYGQLFVFGGKLWVTTSSSTDEQTFLRSYARTG